MSRKKVKGKAAESDELETRLLIDKVRSLINVITPTSGEELFREFLDLKVYRSPGLKDIVALIWDKAIETSEYCVLYAQICFAQIQEEIDFNYDVLSYFREAIYNRCQETWIDETNNENDFVKQKQAEIASQIDEKRKMKARIELTKQQISFRKRRIGCIKFIGHLYQHNAFTMIDIRFYTASLHSTVRARHAIPGLEIDEVAVECVAILFEIIGKKVQKHNERADFLESTKGKGSFCVSLAVAAEIQRQHFPLDFCFETLETAIPLVNIRLSERIIRLMDLRANGWTHDRRTDIPTEGSCGKGGIFDLVPPKVLEEANASLKVLGILTFDAPSKDPPWKHQQQIAADDAEDAAAHQSEELNKENERLRVTVAGMYEIYRRLNRRLRRAERQRRYRRKRTWRLPN